MVHPFLFPVERGDGTDVFLCHFLGCGFLDVAYDKECEVAGIADTVTVDFLNAVECKFVDVGIVEQLYARMIVGRNHSDGVAHHRLRPSGRLFGCDAVAFYEYVMNLRIETGRSEAEVYHLHHRLEVFG